MNAPSINKASRVHLYEDREKLPVMMLAPGVSHARTSNPQ
jgi:hypothetical protein